jgi:hypothetical protein
MKAAGPTQRAGQRKKFGVIAQLGERFNGIEEVGGSIPPGSTKLPLPRHHLELITST